MRRVWSMSKAYLRDYNIPENIICEWHPPCILLPPNGNAEYPLSPFFPPFAFSGMQQFMELIDTFFELYISLIQTTV